MQISIRTLLAVLLLAALAFPNVIALTKIRQRQEELSLLQHELEETQRRLESNAAPVPMLAERVQDEYRQLSRTREIAVEHFYKLQERYGRVEKRDDQTLSLRGIPKLSIDGKPTPVGFRLVVPSARPVWFKCAVVTRRLGSGDTKTLDGLSEGDGDLAEDFDGPFEVRLLPGQRDLELQIGPTKGAQLPVEIRLDGKILFASSHDQGDDGSSGASYIGGRSQTDYGPDRELPWLMDARVSIPADEGGQTVETKYHYSFWLSDQSSGFKTFPGA
ncbi:hypothetical protein FYK55_17885 [Roseiconus nitratireducens]|uniref:Uncharacterized protein n=1 Tax=Roseiconus nitratireducens TaxID=2605748 RepID=A0A5M6D3H2_9BACT|nr:hypothetical protein [Roseiconus nitratireducens]KAA5541436.1 hypothetical protein FYK55_17885 [Roseiconus nitratireducens]